jgi:hypothetical protein
MRAKSGKVKISMSLEEAIKLMQCFKSFNEGRNDYTLMQEVGAPLLRELEGLLAGRNT